MRTIFDDFDDLFELGFGKAKNLKFNTNGTKDMSPAYWKKTDNGYEAVCRTVGISPEDVKVSIDGNNICVNGVTTYGSNAYDCSYELPVADSIIELIDSVEYTSKDGLTYIYLNLIQPKHREIAIKMR